MDSLPGGKGKPLADSVHLGSESIDDDSIERIKAEEEELLKKLKDIDSERTNIETSLKLRRERLIKKLTYNVEDLHKRLADMKLDNDRLNKELAEQKYVVHFSFQEKRQLVEDLEGRCRALEKEVGEKRAHEIATASGNNPKLEDIIQMIDKFLVAEDSVVPGSLHLPELEVALKTIAKLSKRIADFSDKNRPTKIADLYNELYDNEWTDAFDVIQETAYTGTEDRDIAKQLYDILMDINTFCKKEARVQAELIKQSLQVIDTGGTLVSSTPQQLKEFQRSNADCGVQGVCQKYMTYNRTRDGMLSHNTRKVPHFVRKCIEVCWIMALQDPPLDFKDKIQSYAQFNKGEFRVYTKSGQYIHFVLWPPLLLHKGGPVLAKGVAQGLQSERVTKAD